MLGYNVFCMFSGNVYPTGTSCCPLITLGPLLLLCRFQRVILEHLGDSLIPPWDVPTPYLYTVIYGYFIYLIGFFDSFILYPFSSLFFSSSFFSLWWWFWLWPWTMLLLPYCFPWICYGPHKHFILECTRLQHPAKAHQSNAFLCN